MPSFKLQALPPPKMVSSAEHLKAIEKAVYKAAGLALRDLESTVRTWKHKPTFDVTITQQGDSYSVTAGTDDEIYGYVNNGTRPHAIRPKRSRYLKFGSGFRAKTRVGVIGSFQGGSFGNDIFSRGVQHPGFPGRKFTERIAQRRQVTTQQEIQHGIALVVQNKPS